MSSTVNIPLQKVTVPVSKLGLTRTDMVAVVASAAAMASVKAIARHRGHMQADGKRMDTQAALTSGLASLTATAIVHLLRDKQA